MSDDRLAASVGGSGNQFASLAEHEHWLESEAALPSGFRCGTYTFDFVAAETNQSAHMTLSLLTVDQPMDSWASVFTRNAFPGAPIIIGRQRLSSGSPIAAWVINNKISNVCAPDGVATAEAVCAAVAAGLDVDAAMVVPSSTGIIGWQLPRDDLIQAVPHAIAALQGESALGLAEGIMTTDLYPKVRRIAVPGGGSIVGVAKGAGMVEPNLATMLVYFMTDVQISQADLQQALNHAVATSFNAISIDTDQSTSDTVAIISSGQVQGINSDTFTEALTEVCEALAADVVRNGEGVHHVIRVTVSSAPSTAIAKGIAKAVINSPLLQCAIAGNDPNVGRLVMAVGKHMGDHHPLLSTDKVEMTIAGETVFAGGVFHLDPAREARLSAALKHAEMYASLGPNDQGVYVPPINYPPHEREFGIEVRLGLGDASFTAIGGDRTHEYISENADYRS
jgi:glutamate N-acetyltransferase/amino-acid N-acetyltransferase